LSSVGRANLQVEVSLSGIQSREKQVQIFPWHVQHPAGLEVMDIRPRSIQVQLEMRIEKEVEVKPAFHGEKNEDYTYQIDISPDTAIVAGVRSELENLNAIQLAELQLPAPEDPPLETNVEAVLPPHLVLVDPPANSFFITVEVFEPHMKRTIEGVKVEVRGKPSEGRAIVEPSEIDVKVSGPKNVVRDLRPEDIIAYVNAPESGMGPEIKVIRFSLPESVEQVESAELARTAKVRLVGQ
jgi:YbbR domain-containing protein